MTIPVINWHILERCNFNCKYCFAHWPSLNSSTPAFEVWQNPKLTDKLLSELAQLPSVLSGEWSGTPRLNFAGGEPLLLWKTHLPKILDMAEHLDFSLSIVTNGFLWTDEIVRKLAPRLQILGISMDTANTETNRKIGRCGTNSTQQITPERVAEIFRLAREVNPEIECKLNTVICAENWREDFHSTIAQIMPDRWKVFQMLPIANEEKYRKKQKPLVVKDKWFDEFKIRHSDLKMMRPENNDQMTESYVMVDPFGRFYQNEPALIGHGYIVSEPIHEVGVQAAWSGMQLRFHAGKFQDRYVSTT